MNRFSMFLGGIVVGAGLMYVLDPDCGGRRRTAVRDRTLRTMHRTRQRLGKVGRDLQNRVRGALTETFGPTNDRPDDSTLVDRIRSKLGHYVSHPGVIDVHAEHGRVSLRGPILRDEAPRLLSMVAAMRGVTHVSHELQTH